MIDDRLHARGQPQPHLGEDGKSKNGSTARFHPDVEGFRWVAVVVLGDMPVLEPTNPECLAAHLSHIQQCGSTRKEALTGVFTTAEQAAAAAGGADYIDVSDWFCDQRCSPIIAGKQVYRNRFHITATFATFVSGALATSKSSPAKAQVQ